MSSAAALRTSSASCFFVTLRSFQFELISPATVTTTARSATIRDGHRCITDLVSEKYEWAMIVESSANLETIEKQIDQYSAAEFRKVSGQHSQALLKYAWGTGDKRAIDAIALSTAENLRSHVDIHSGAVVITVANCWPLICMLFLRDHAAEKTAVCANPECPAPYFLKSRKTQRICEAGACVAWAQRNYARKWWRENESKASKAKPKGKAE